ncbi:fimbrial chaperone [Citrobacter arsenatis]|uniref:fimbrial chaperone n=1 Tax=Citrobacter arsenatis TaxID=2546350 RepID=UPI00300DF8E1
MNTAPFPLENIMRYPFGLNAILASFTLLVSTFSHADVVISGTRVIYKAGLSDVTLNINNTGKHPVLTQLWVDDGQDNTQPHKMKVPFFVTPPLSRLDPLRGQTVKISWFNQGAPLPNDRESLYWFNVLEVPEKAGGQGNILQLAFRTRIKLFYRPEGLTGTSGEAAHNLDWSVKEDKGKIVAHVKNSSGYFISFNNAKLVTGHGDFTLQTKMLAPKSEDDFLIENLHLREKGVINYSTINDFGGSQENKAVL